jgi:HAD superfamily hydrolase (TIGR01509 family)
VINHVGHTEFRAVIFDCDGVLIQSEPAWKAAETDLCRLFGMDPGIAMQTDTRGLSVETTVRVLLGDDPPGGSQHAQQILTALAESLIRSESQAVPGAVNLLVGLSREIRVGVASNTPRPLLVTLLRELGVEPHLSVIASSDDVARAKPAPDVYIYACRELGLEPAEVLVVEDSIAGIKAAVSAGCPVVQILGAGVDKADEACAHFRDLELAPALFFEEVTRRMGDQIR